MFPCLQLVIFEGLNSLLRLKIVLDVLFCSYVIFPEFWIGIHKASPFERPGNIDRAPDDP